jgi:hypothetical protein
MTTTLPCARGTPAFALFYRLRLLKAASGRRQHPPGLPRVTPGSPNDAPGRPVALTSAAAFWTSLAIVAPDIKGFAAIASGRQYLLEGLMARRLKQADRRGRADEKGNPHIERGRWQAVVFESSNEIIHIGAGGPAREDNLRSAGEHLPLSEAGDLVGKSLFTTTRNVDSMK